MSHPTPNTRASEVTPARTPPLIGVVLDWEAPTQGQNTQRYLLRQHYCDAIIAAGGQPLAIPYGPAGYIPRLLDTLDGLVVPGGDYPFPDAWYGEGHPPSPYGQGPSPRAAFEAQITQQALDRPLPCLGICAGMQVMAALLGCRLTGDCRTLVANDHRVPHPERPCHPIVVTPHTRLRALAATDIVQVNSAHREAVAEVAPGVMVGAWAEDGLIEAIELDDHPFAVGVQWHPEYWVAPEAPLGADLLHRRLFEGLVDAAGRA